jgi:tetratricopeptide (TPR) repeat protein
MLTAVRTLTRGLTYPFRAVRRAPRAVQFGLVPVALLALAAAGWYGYGRWQFSRARKDLAAERYPDAVRRLDWCRRWVRPVDPAIWLSAARASRKAGDTAKAESHLNECRKLSGGSTEAIQLEYLLIRAQSLDDEAANPLFALVEEGHPESGEILETLGLAYIRRLRYLPANACMTKWIELRPDAARPYHFRGWVYEKTGSPRQAVADYQAALARDPSLTAVRLRLVELLLEDKKVPEATPHLEELLRQTPDRADVKARLGMLRFLEGRSGDARGLLEAAEPTLAKEDLPGPLVTLARLDVQDGKPADAERRLRRVIALDESEIEARFVLVSALRMQGKDAEADEAEKEHNRIRLRNERVNNLLRDKAETRDATPDVWCEIATIFLDMKLEAKARYWFDKALSKDPFHQPTHRALAEFYERKGEAATAATHRRLLRDDPAPPAKTP